MTITITKQEPGRGPRNKLAEAELVFDHRDGILWDSHAGVLDGLKLTGITIWNSERGPFVSFPGRQYEDREGKKKNFDYVRSIERGFEKLDALKGYILQVYEAS